MSKSVKRILCETRGLWTGKCIPDCCYKPECDKLLSQLRELIKGARPPDKKVMEAEHDCCPYTLCVSNSAFGACRYGGSPKICAYGRDAQLRIDLHNAALADYDRSLDEVLGKEEE